MRNRIVDLIEAQAQADPNVLFLSGDLGFSVVENIQQSLGPRFINCGVAEANMATMAGALSLSGFRVYIYSIAPFVTLRCIEQLRNDVCYQGTDVRVVGIGAGLSYGSLGPSHHCLEDAAIMAALPGMRVLCPAGMGELDQMFAAMDGVRDPIYFRIGRERGPDLTPPGLTVHDPAWMVQDGSDATLLCSGAIVATAQQAAQSLAGQGVSLRIVSVPQMQPFPAQTVWPLVAKDGPVLTLAEAYPDNPLEAGAMRMVLQHGPRPFASIHIAHHFPKIVGSHLTLRDQGGISTDKVCHAVLALRGRS